MKAIYSYWNKVGNDNKSGYNNLKDLCACTALSVENTLKHFGNAELITNDFGYDLLINKAKIPFTSVNLELNKFDNLDQYFWGFTKIVAYSLQKEPFIHIDNDFIIWDKPSKEILSKDLFFQSEEPFDDDIYRYYKPLLELFYNAPFKSDKISNNPTKLAFNCGIMGANNLEVIKEWRELAENYISNKQNIDYFYKNPEMLIHLNLLHEQYFIASLIKSNKLNVGVLVDNIFEASKNGKRFTHLWGTVKRKDFIINKVYRRLFGDFPKYKEILNNIEN